MAQKKRKRQHRNPVAPKIHSAPGAASTPASQSTQPPPGRPAGAVPPSSAASPPAPVKGAETARRKQTPRQRQNVRKRQARRRNILVIGSIVLLIVAGIVASQVLGNRASSRFNALAKAEGCSEVRETGGGGAGEHLSEGQGTKYDSSPPTSGKHAQTTIPAAVYEEPLSDDPSVDLNIFRSVHSLEHGAIIVWHDRLSKDDEEKIDRKYRNEKKVLVVPYPELKNDTKVALTAWGRMVTCDGASTKVIDAFVERFREARSAPEPKNRI